MDSRLESEFSVFIQEKENIRKRKGSDATFEHIMKISRMNEQIKWLRSELNKTSWFLESLYLYHTV